MLMAGSIPYLRGPLIQLLDYHRSLEVGVVAMAAVVATSRNLDPITAAAPFYASYTFVKLHVIFALFGQLELTVIMYKGKN
jgi:hypothetical protein